MSSYEGIVVGRRGQYRLIKELHKSEMSIIYRGERLSDGLRVAVKFPRRKGEFYDELIVNRLRNEIEVLKNLDHENIVKYIDEGMKSVFLVMKYIEGVPLTKVGRMEPKKALRVFRQVMSAVAYLHERGYVHGDIKSGNILLEREDRPVLIDFGTAEHISYEQSMTRNPRPRTPDWIAPEENEGILTPETDIYHLGELLFYMLTGENPKKHMKKWDPLDPIRVADLKGRVANFILRAMAPTPAERYRSVEEARAELFFRAEVIYKGMSYEVWDRLTIGRDSSNDIVVEDPKRYVHEKHCVIYFNNGRYYLEPRINEWSERINYPYVRRKGSYIKVEDRIELRDGDTIVLCYNPKKGPYIELPFRILSDF